ncbi:MAG: radical SAM/SPASM domain-containing protein [Oscillospiraceae bacterium]|nr:radical SAM/SPASM domain-containing protein [Oscillospiraceae bacterium]
MESLEQSLTDSVEKIIRQARKQALKNPKQSLFLAQYAAASRGAAQKRKKAAQCGAPIPPFLIASITAQCNLHCAGCYARAGQTCGDSEMARALTDAQWGAIFAEAQALGVGFILLAGGEPMLRMGVLEQAAMTRKIVFPVFTNGTLLQQAQLALLDDCRNLIPVLSLEGGAARTEQRRGAGVYSLLETAMNKLQEKRIFFGASITVTTENLQEVTADAFLRALADKGCKLVIYVDYEPVTDKTRDLAPGAAERAYLQARLSQLRSRDDALLTLAFPGDELQTGGCLAAGRGFFHINAAGGAEPCPFSPVSDANVAAVGLAAALRSPLFRALRESVMLQSPHDGACALFGRTREVEQLITR